MQFLQLQEELDFFKSKFEITKALEQVATSSGYTLFEPEFFESYDRFIKMNPRVKSQSLVKLLDNDGSVLVLRPDITTSVIKRVIPKWQPGTILKLFYLSTIFSRNQQGMIDERKQFGIEHLGGDPRQADVETVLLILNMLKRFDLPFLLEISNNRFLDALIRELKLSKDDEKALKDILYYKNRGALETFIERSNIGEREASLIRNILNLQGSLEEVRTVLASYPLTLSMLDAIKELEWLTASIPTDDLINYIKVDLTVLSQYDYYDGLIFKAYVPSASAPILSGGRYDPLTETYGKKISAIGFTMNTSDLIKEVILNHE